MSEIRHVGLLLAAGSGSRFGGAYPGAKLDHEIDGVPIGVRTFETLASVCEAMIVVVRDPKSQLACAAREQGAHVVVNETPARGLGASLAIGSAFAINNFSNARFLWVQLADMPFIKSNTLRLLDPKKLGKEDKSYMQILRPRFLGAALIEGETTARKRAGHPVVFGRAHWDALTQLDGDVGAQAVIAANRDCLFEVDTDDEGVWRDIDSIADLARP